MSRDKQLKQSFMTNTTSTPLASGKTATTPVDTGQHGPSNYVYGSFNIFDPSLGLDIINLVKNTGIICTNNLIIEGIDPAKDIVLNPNGGTIYTYSSSEVNSTSEVSKKLSESLNIKASYGIYSGSASLARTTSSVTKNTSYMAIATGIADGGTTNYKVNTLTFNMLCSDVQNMLKAITDLKSAEAFVNTYGTHIITGLRMGGMFSFMVTAESTSTTDNSSISASLSTGINTGTASASATSSFQSSLETQYANHKLSMHLQTLGTDVLYFGPPKSGDPNYQAWIDSLQNTWLSVSDTVEFYTLDTTNTWGPILQHYMNLNYLSHSFNKPLIYSVSTPTIPGNYTSVTLNLGDVIGSNIQQSAVKILSGGAKVVDNSNSFLTGSYPYLNNNTIVGWCAESHDISDPCLATESLYAYAIAVYDPGNLLNVIVNTANGTNPGVGPDLVNLAALVNKNQIITGGGCLINHSQNSGAGPKFIFSNYPTPFPVGTQWCVDVKDYFFAASNCVLTGFAIILTLNSVSGLNLQIQINDCGNSKLNHNQKQYTSKTGNPIIGGGVGISRVNSNILQASYPLDAMHWYGSDKDTDGNVDDETQTCYMVSCTCSVNAG